MIGDHQDAAGAEIAVDDTTTFGVADIHTKMRRKLLIRGKVFGDQHGGFANSNVIFGVEYLAVGVVERFENFSKIK